MGRSLKCRKEPAGRGVRGAGHKKKNMVLVLCVTWQGEVEMKGVDGGRNIRERLRERHKGSVWGEVLRNRVIELDSPPTSCTIPGA